VVETRTGATLRPAFATGIIFPIRDSRGPNARLLRPSPGTTSPSNLNSPETPSNHKGREL